ncbi:MAG: signal recognition particle-docking protein FtsY [Candidatus Aenigmatarchaeota archaeon]
MFGSLKKKLKESIKGLAERVKEEHVEPKPQRTRPSKKATPQPVEEEHEKGFVAKFKSKVTEKTITSEDIDKFFSGQETDLLQSNIALEVADYIRQRLKEEIADTPIKRSHVEDNIKETFHKILMEIVDQSNLDIVKAVEKGVGKPCFIFLGFNGAGKTTSLAKVGNYLLGKGKSVVFAAGDSFRAASIEQIQHHGDKLGIKVIKHTYGADSAAVIFDAVKYAESHGVDIVLADTAGRMHSDKNLIDELKKVVRVNQPRLKILVIDSLTGNDAVEQAKAFNDAVGVDAVIMGKADVNEKGGSILSVCYAIKKPILFLGTGQEYKDLQRFDPKKFVDELLG